MPALYARSMDKKYQKMLTASWYIVGVQKMIAILIAKIITYIITVKQQRSYLVGNLMSEDWLKKNKGRGQVHFLFWSKWRNHRKERVSFEQF